MSPYAGTTIDATSVEESSSVEAPIGGRVASAPYTPVSPQLPCTYVLPIRLDDTPPRELTEYLRGVASVCDVVIADGSQHELFTSAHREWARFATHVRLGENLDCSNAKVRGVLTAFAHVRTPLAVIADDDVRYTEQNLHDVVGALADADLVVPQNYFDPLPWHACWDTARTLINRATGGDFPGTLALRIGALGPDGYDGDVLFENLELMRTVVARGGTCRREPEIFIRRIPPTAAHFGSQRVRQAYDEFARPGRLATWLMIAPAILLSRRRLLSAGAVSAVGIAVAEIGRRSSNGRQHFPWSSSLAAPLWVGERAVCAWVAVLCRARGGVRYGDGRLRRAANRTARLRRDLGSVS